MSFSVHRPGRFDSDGRIELDAPDAEDETEPLYLSDLQGMDDPDAPAEPEPAEFAPAPDAPAEPAPTRRPRRARAGMPWTRRLAVLGGADADVLAEVPIETPRFVQMFFVLAGTALVSALSMFFALMTGVRVAVWVAVPIALVWALIIFNLDRFLTSTMRATHSALKLLGLALPRVVMAAIIGIVVAEPLVLQVFHNDIAREVTSSNVAHALADQKGVSDGPEKKAMDAATTRVAALENQAATGIVAGTSSTSAASVAAQQTVDDLDAKLAAQAEGHRPGARPLSVRADRKGAGQRPGCTGVVGSGASSAAAKDQLAAAQSSYDALAAKLRDANAALAAADASGTAAVGAAEAQNKKQAQDQLPAARATYKAALAAYDARASSVAGGNADAVGLLSQIGALDRLSQKEPTLAWAHWLIAALFFMIELLPVLVKVLTSYGDPSLYEKADALRRQVALDRVTSRKLERAGRHRPGKRRLTDRAGFGIRPTAFRSQEDLCGLSVSNGVSRMPRSNVLRDEQGAVRHR
ncbi:DUF4407 domain-containing protein [Microbacterium elymi]|uniref:DUF4407 domain-containing protein n=1 Tax=Microbacterium elymi TaxID=2909587 RepID=A0ABY5NHB9_9MICO|nr:DUF4407 domain-containing protein [Microbacterium elymi]UUT34555.1 DUF4407 domain-containing protein [Microbacterium elymi]